MSARGGSIRYAMETCCFFAAIQDAWCRETSSEPDVWSADNPSWGQCAITALVVQDGLGGALLRGTVRGISHYWNLLDGGGELDLTRGQFGEGSIPDAAPIIREREYVESSPETMARYRLLRERMGL